MDVVTFGLDVLISSLTVDLIGSFLVVASNVVRFVVVKINDFVVLSIINYRLIAYILNIIIYQSVINHAF